jgi:anti-sigma B factor antagonist
MFTAVHLTIRDGVPVLHVAGDLDLEARCKVDRGLADVRRTGPHPLLVIDLTDVHFADSTGLGLLVRARQEQLGCGGDLALVVSADRLRRTLRISALARMFTIHDDLAGALASAGPLPSPAPRSVVARRR